MNGCKPAQTTRTSREPGAGHKPGLGWRCRGSGGLTGDLGPQHLHPSPCLGVGKVGLLKRMEDKGCGDESPLQAQVPVQTPVPLHVPVLVETPVSLHAAVPMQAPVLLHTPVPLHAAVSMQAPVPVQMPVPLHIPVPMQASVPLHA